MPNPHPQKPRQPKPASAILTKSLPLRCPGCWGAHTATRESGGVVRLTCARCEWTERYVVTG